MVPNRLFSNKFSLLVTGEAASLLGDQFTRIALIWMILDMTGSSSAVGIWLAIGTIPRAAFLLVGGALSDGFSPRPIMILSNVGRFVLVGILIVAAATNTISYNGLCVFAVLFGAASALYTPSLPAILPRIISSELLQRGNSIVQGAMHIANLVGPPVAAFVLASLTNEFNTIPEDGFEQSSYAILFSIDAATFLVSIWTLSLIGSLPNETAGKEQSKMLKGVWDGLRFVVGNKRLRVFVLIAVTSNFGIGGPLAVGLPLLAKYALPQGVIALGVLSAAGAVGGILGLALAAVFKQQSPERLFAMPFLFLPLIGVIMATLGWATSIERAALSIGLMVTLAVYLDIQVITWLQQSTSPKYLGRTMSILQFGALGTLPISMAIAGYVGTNLTIMFAGFGGFVVVAPLLLLINATRAKARQ